jgi:hypothetical protein
MHPPAVGLTLSTSPLSPWPQSTVATTCASRGRVSSLLEIDKGLPKLRSAAVCLAESGPPPAMRGTHLHLLMRPRICFVRRAGRVLSLALFDDMYVPPREESSDARTRSQRPSRVRSLPPVKLGTCLSPPGDRSLLMALASRSLLRQLVVAGPLHQSHQYEYGRDGQKPSQDRGHQRQTP